MLCQFLLYNKVNQLCVYIYISSLLNPPPISLPSSHSSRSSQSTELNSLCYTAASYQLHISCIVVLICQCCSLSPSHPPFPPLVSTSTFMSASLFLPNKQFHLYHFSRFHIYELIYDVCFFQLLYNNLYNLLYNFCITTDSV